MSQKQIFQLVLAAITLSTATAHADKFEIIDDSDPQVFLINPNDPEIEIRDNYIRRITMGKDNATILFHNTTTKNWSPRLTLYLLDKYGIPIKSAYESWMLNTVPAGETKSHDSGFHDAKVIKELQFTKLKIPQDAGKEAVFLAVRYH